MYLKVSDHGLMDKFKTMSKKQLAGYIHRRRFIELAEWPELEVEIGLSDRSMRRILKIEGFESTNAVPSSTLKNVSRNQMIIKVIKDAAAENRVISQQGVADAVTAAGFPVNRGTVNGVIDRAREHGLLPPDWDKTKPRITKRVNYGFIGPYTGPGKPEGLPPRTPELLSRGRVPHDQLAIGGCRYTPSEEAPFLFCGEAVTNQSSWCNHCYQNIIRRQPDGTKKETSKGEDKIISN